MGPLLPQWLELAWTAVFIAVGCSHLRHMAQAGGQRRAWHACHVLMALGMAFMYLPVALLPVAVSASFWPIVFAAAGTMAAFWALGASNSGSTLIWLLTALDLGVMWLMWAGEESRIAPPLVWLAVIYLAVEAGLWLFDGYRQFDGAAGLLNWRVLATDSGELVLADAVAQPAGLLGDLDITVSMALMASGMAYMVVAMLVM